jgi:hypothetical protein
MGNIINLVGKVFNRWTVVGRAENKNKRVRWSCVCECGEERDVIAYNLVHGISKSCGCLNKDLAKERIISITKTHGLSKTPIHRIWCGIKTRVGNPNHKDYQWYGARGVTMCEEWENDFMSFYTWSTNNGWKDGLQIDRKDVNGNYEPSNCRWVTNEVNSKNRRNTNLYTNELTGETLCASDWSKRLGGNQELVKSRIAYGWSIQRAITEPIRKQYESINI